MQITEAGAEERIALATRAARLLTEEMAAKSWTQSDLARVAGIPAHKVNRVIQATGLAGLDVYLRLAKAVGKTLDELFIAPATKPVDKFGNKKKKAKPKALARR